MLETLQHVGFIAASFVAAGVATIAGFGSSTLLIPIAIMFMPLRQAVFLVACFYLFNNIFKVRAFHTDINKRVALLFGIPSIIMSFIGALLISVLPADMVKMSIAVFLLIFSVYVWVKPDFKINNSGSNAVIGGHRRVCLTVLSAWAGLYAEYFSWLSGCREGTSAIIAFAIDCTRVPTYMFTGAVGGKSGFVLMPFLVISAYSGVKTGKIYLEKRD